MSDWFFKFFCWRKGQFVGSDSFGNRYYQTKKPAGKNLKEKRWVIYHGEQEGSKVPAEWHGWLHFRTNELPNLEYLYYWQKPHLPNLTGTSLANLYHRNSLHLPLNLSTPQYIPWDPSNK